MPFFPSAAAFTHTASVIRGEVGRVPNDAEKFKIFKHYSQLDDTAARRALKWGEEPTIRVSRNLRAGTWGEHSTFGGIKLNEIILLQFERVFQSAGNANAMGLNKGQDALRWDRLIKKSILAMESLVLHEMVHWGDMQDGQTRDLQAMRHGWKDVGHMFVSEAYRGVFKIVKEKRRRYVVKLPNTEIDGWMGWDQYGRPFDPWSNMNPIAGVVAPPTGI